MNLVIFEIIVDSSTRFVMSWVLDLYLQYTNTTNTLIENDSVMFQIHSIIKAFKSHQKFI